jgi:Cys-rich protein (TIGR01571 family)
MSSSSSSIQVMDQEWVTGICGCCQSNNCGLCCLACIAPCIPYAQNLEKMKQLGIWSCLPDCGITEMPAIIHGCMYITGCCLLPALGTLAFSGNNVITTIGGAIQIIPCCLHYVTRNDIRVGASIPSCGLDDLCIVCWCYSCALTQQSIQLESMMKGADDSMQPINLPPNSMKQKKNKNQKE